MIRYIILYGYYRDFVGDQSGQNIQLLLVELLSLKKWKNTYKIRIAHLIKIDQRQVLKIHNDYIRRRLVIRTGVSSSLKSYVLLAKSRATLILTCQGLRTSL